MALRGTDPASYITEHTLVYEDQANEVELSHPTRTKKKRSVTHLARQAQLPPPNLQPYPFNQPNIQTTK